MATSVLAASLCAAGSSLAQPLEAATDSLRLSGFGTVGISRASAPPGWGFQRDSTQAANDGGTRVDTDTRLGLQANFAIDSHFELVGQLLLKHSVPTAKLSDAISWAFATYRPTDSTAVRVGRLAPSSYLLSDYRSVGLAFPFVRPPPEYYAFLPAMVDGFDVSHTWQDHSGASWKLSATHGQSKQIANGSGFRKIRPIDVVYLSREEQGLVVKASVVRARLKGGIPEAAQLVGALQPLTTLPVSEIAAEAATLQQPFTSAQTALYSALGINFDRADWLIMVEASHANLDNVLSLDAGYALVGHRFGSFTPYVALSAARTRAQGGAPQWEATLTPLLGPQGAAQAQALGEAAYAAARIGPKQQSISLGVRYDLSPQSALKIQYDRTRIGSRGSQLWSNASDQAARAHVISAALDFVF